MTWKNILGVVLIASIFIVIFIAASKRDGFKETAITFITGFSLAILVTLGAYLIAS